MEESPPPSSSHPLLDRARSGDLTALVRLLQPLRSDLVRIVQVIAGPLLRKQLDPEDVFQDSLIAAMRSIRGLRARDLRGLRSWFLTIARHRVLLFRRQGRARAWPRRNTALPASPYGSTTSQA